MTRADEGWEGEDEAVHIALSVIANRRSFVLIRLHANHWAQPHRLPLAAHIHSARATDDDDDDEEEAI